MRKTIKTVLFLFTIISVRSFGQQTITDLTSTIKEATGDIYSIYDLDVFSYYKLSDYDTELKKAVFQKTDEYQKKLTELKSIKTEMLKTTYYAKLEDVFYVNYNLKLKGFEIDLGSNFGMGTMSARTPKSIYFKDGLSVLLKTLPSKQVADPTMGQGVYLEKLLLPMSEEIGLEIENDKNNAVIYFFFIPTGKEISYIKFLNTDGAWYNITHNDIKSDKVRIVVANKSTGKIYFDKSY